MSDKKLPGWVIAIGVIGLVASLSTVVHSLATGEGIDTLSLLMSILLVLLLVRARNWRA